jgi:hypothetical protein
MRSCHERCFEMAFELVPGFCALFISILSALLLLNENICPPGESLDEDVDCELNRDCKPRGSGFFFSFLFSLIELKNSPREGRRMKIVNLNCECRVETIFTRGVNTLGLAASSSRCGSGRLSGILIMFTCCFAERLPEALLPRCAKEILHAAH